MILIVKNDCFIVNKIFFEVIFEKFGCKKNFIFFIVLLSVNEWIIRVINKMNNVGNIYLFVFLILFCIFFDIIYIVMNIKVKCFIIV